MPFPRADHPQEVSCPICHGRGTITRLTGRKDDAGNPTTETVTCTGCNGSGKG